MPASPGAELVALTVHYRSRGTVAGLFRDLALQDHPNLSVIVVECGDDGSVADALPALGSTPCRVIDPGANLGYCGGNNLGFLRRPQGSDVLVINPDVRISAPGALSTLHGELLSRPKLGAVGPAIFTPAGRLEHADSQLDYSSWLAIHTRTHVPAWPDDLPSDIHEVAWLDGAVFLARGRALDDVGGFDDRFFLYFEEVDWSIRMAAAGWQLGIVPAVRAVHDRSSSFQGSSKGSYYYWRNNYLLFRKHGAGRVGRRRWARRLLRSVVRRPFSKSSWNALWGGLDALRGRTGPRPGRGWA